MTRLIRESAHPGSARSDRRAERIEVRRRDDIPEQFLWRGRLYVVRAVLACWTESGGWWRGAGVRALGDGEQPDGERPGVIDDSERDWWRVEADSGRLASFDDSASAGTGVYDLCFDWSRGAWSLARVLD